MVGGKVIGVVRGPENTLLHVEDKGDRLSVRCVERDDEKVRLGDSVWWQAGKVYWTPSRFRRTAEADQWRDVPLAKVGYSH